jgi:hypothetical protein
MKISKLGEHKINKQMKELVFLLFIVVVPTSLFAQSEIPELTGAMGLTFGMNKITVKAILLQKGAEFHDEGTNNLSFRTIPIGTKKADMGIAQFVNDKLHTIKLFFLPDVEGNTQALYDELQGTLTDKYGKPDSNRHFDGIYQDGDGNEMQAIREGHGTIASYWNFKNDNIVSLEIGNVGYNMHVIIVYQDDKLLSEAIAQKKSKDNTEF